MESALLDTSVVSFLHPGKDASSFKELYLDVLSDRHLAISFQTVAELLYWAECRNWNNRRKLHLKSFLETFDIVPYCQELAEIWASIRFASGRIGKRLDIGDCWIAASAVYLKAPLITHDKDFLNLAIKDLQIICRAE